MASCATLSASSLRLPSSALADPSSLACSSSPFLASALPVAPLNRPAAAAALVSARCSVSNESSSKATARREILAGIASAGAALAVFSNVSLAAIGPGTSGAERTAQKADELLKAADKLNIEDAPKRFGPGRVEGGDPGKNSQQAGSGIVRGLQEGVSDIGKDVSAKAGDILDGDKISQRTGLQEGVGDIGKDISAKAGGILDGDKIAQQTGVLAVKGEGAGDVAKEASKKSGEIEKRTKNIYGQFVARKGEVESAAKELVGQAQKKGSEVTGGGGGKFFGSIKQTVKGIKESVPSLPQ